MAKRGVRFSVEFGANPGIDWRLPGAMNSDWQLQWHRVDREDVTVQPTARDEVIAALEALDALEKCTHA